MRLEAGRQAPDVARQPELEEARDKVRWGRERRSMAMTDEDKKFTAWHEAGHALVNVMLTQPDPARYIVLGLILIALMIIRPNGLLGERRVEIV